jgi:beta-lactamase class A
VSVPLADLAAQAGLDGARIHLIEIDGVRAWSLDDGAYIYPASLIKLPLAAVAAAEVTRGVRRWDDAVTVGAGAWTVNDAPSPLEIGNSASLEELVTLMLQRSDNVATNVLIDLFERGAASALLGELGFPGTRVRRKVSGALPLIYDPQADGRNRFPPAECAAMLLAIARGGLPDAARLRTILAENWWNTKLSSGLLPGERFAHKTGDTSDVSHDAGILELCDGSRWVLAVYTELEASEANDPRFGAFLTLLRPHLLKA